GLGDGVDRGAGGEVAVRRREGRRDVVRAAGQLGGRGREGRGRRAAHVHQVDGADRAAVVQERDRAVRLGVAVARVEDRRRHGRRERRRRPERGRVRRGRRRDRRRGPVRGDLLGDRVRRVRRGGAGEVEVGGGGGVHGGDGVRAAGQLGRRGG